MAEDIYGIQPEPSRGDPGKQGNQGKPPGVQRPDTFQSLPSYPGSAPSAGGTPQDEEARRKLREAEELLARLRQLEAAKGSASGGGHGGGMSSTAIGWLIFFLIFGVGNVILYSTTGIFLIPIPRR
jgi:hypothetical protein